MHINGSDLPLFVSRSLSLSLSLAYSLTIFTVLFQHTHERAMRQALHLLGVWIVLPFLSSDELKLKS